MKIEKFLLFLFEGEQKLESAVTVPEGSKLLDAKIINDGIYLWYMIPDSITEITRTDKFCIVKPGMVISDDAKFVTILETTIEMPAPDGTIQAGVVIFPLFQI